MATAGVTGCSSPRLGPPVWFDGDADVGPGDVAETADAVVPGDAAPAPCPDLPPAEGLGVVQTQYATVRGAPDGDGWKFLAIRYAAPPVGSLRFARPAPPACAESIVDATAHGPACPQLGLSLDAVSGEEDCLFLNVFIPPRPNYDPLPVLVFIHGGGNNMGSAPEPAAVAGLAEGFYDGTPIARDGHAIVVTLNYRLAALGFLAHPALRDAEGGSGNWAVHDWLAALRWVRDNIAAFGGDPSRVAVFGESAGGLAVCTLLATPAAAGLFSAAIVESGGCDAPDRAQREGVGGQLAAAVHCDTAADVAACLRQVSAEDLVRAPSDLSSGLIHTWWLSWGPTVDGVTLPRVPRHALQRGEHHQVPLIVGNNAEETNLFFPGPGPLTCWDYDLAVDTLFGDAAPAILERYPCGSDPFARDGFIRLTTDAMFACEARRLAHDAAAHQSAPVFRYHFRDRANWGPLWAMGAFHAVELFYLFDVLERAAYAPSDGEHALGAFMRQRWGELAATGALAPSAVTWPRYDPSAELLLALDEDPGWGMIAVSDLGANASCELWDTLIEAP